MASRLSSLVLLAAVGAVAFALGSRHGGAAATATPDRDRAPAAAPAPASVATTTWAQLAPADLERLRDEIRAAVADELATAAAPPPVEAPPILGAEEARDRAARARSLLDRALAAGHLSLAGHEELHALLAGVPRLEQEPILSALHVAQNQQRLTLDPR